MSNIFQNVKSPRKRYNNFNLGRENLLSGQIGKLIPIQCDEVVPGDRWKQSVGFLLRFAPLSAPAMARFNVHFHSFYVPNRIITTENSNESTFEKFVKSIGKDSSEVPTLPRFVCSGSMLLSDDTLDAGYFNYSMCKVGSLWDYLGLPTSELGSDWKYKDTINALPFFAYQKIYNDFYRRDQIEPEIMFPVNVGNIEFNRFSSSDFDYNSDDTEHTWKFGELFKLRSRNYERDYFTSALPTPQFGEDVSIDGSISWIGGLAGSQLTGNITLAGAQIYGNYGDTFTNNQSAVFYGSQTSDPLLPSVDGSPLNRQIISSQQSIISQQSGKDLASNIASAITVNQLRLAIQLQGIREKINRGGTRYLEIMQSIYGVTVPDARLQRPIYLGGCKNPVSIGAVVQQSESQNTPQGTLTGKATAAGGSNLFSMGYEFKEHGYLLTIMSVTPRTSYYGGIPRKFSKKYPEQFYLPDLDHLGEQEISTQELYYDFSSNDEPRTFGYSPHYSEYKAALSSVHGEFRTTLDNWHVSRDFDEVPSLNTEFIHIEPDDVNRIFEFENIENTSNEHFYAQIYIDAVAKRNMSKYSTPWTLY